MKIAGMRFGLVARALLQALAVVVMPVSVRAQSLRGTVVLPDSVTEAAGVIVQASDGQGRLLQRSLTDSRGRFALTLDAAAPIVLRLLRIGFAPTVVAGIPISRDGGPAVRLVLTDERVQLTRVTVRSDDVCRMSPNDGREVARVWEEARKAMLASQLAELEPLDAEWVEYRRELDATGRIVRTQRMQTVQKPTMHAFRSVPAEQLATRGYVERDDDGTTFNAPDLDVLLSESFAALHCFRLEPATANRAEMVGVGFRPVKVRGDLIDIEGTFWIDRASGELRVLEYRYTNIPDVAVQAGTGGAVEFQRIPSGSWLISRWHIRMPQYSTRTQATRTMAVTRATTGLTFTNQVAEISGLSVTGAQVTRVARGDSALYSVNSGPLRLRLVSRDTAVRLRGATVSIVGTDLIARADSAGLVSIGPMIAGRYRATLSTPTMDSLGVVPIEREVEIADDSTQLVTVTMPSAEEMLRTACSADVAARGLAQVRGVVRDSSGKGIARLPLTLTWIQNVSVVNDRLLWMEQSRNARTDDAGVWHFCGAPREALVTARIASSSARGEGSVRLASHEAFGVIDVRVSVLNASARAADLLRGSAIVEFTIIDNEHRPLADALLDVRVANGKTRSVRADSSGGALVPGLDAGSLRVRARQVGYAAGELSVAIAPGRNTVPIVLDRVRPPTLDTVRVLGDARVLTRHEEFETRRRRGDATAVVTRSEIEARSPVSTWQLLTRLPSVMVVDSADKKVVRTSRRMSIPCAVRVGVNGVLLTESEPDLRDLPPPSEVHGIEVFSGISSAPVQYGARFTDVPLCGLVMIWTR